VITRLRGRVNAITTDLDISLGADSTPSSFTVQVVIVHNDSTGSLKLKVRAGEVDRYYDAFVAGKEIEVAVETDPQ
jgi:hypothetical protein